MTFKTKNATIVFALVAMMMAMPLTMQSANAIETVSSMSAECGYDEANITMPAITRLAEQTQATEAIFGATDGSNTKGGTFSVKATTNWFGDGDRATTAIVFTGAGPVGRVLSANTVTAAGEITSGDVLTIGGTDLFTAGSGTTGANQFDIDGAAAADVIDLARSINALAATTGKVTAVVTNPTTITLTAKVGTTATAGDAIAVVVTTGTSIVATGATLGAGIAGVQGDTITVNSLAYRAAVGVKIDNTEFSMDGSNILDAEALAVSINARDTNVRATNDNTVTTTVNAFVRGSGGNAFGIATTDDAVMDITGTTFAGGGLNVKDHLNAQATKFAIKTDGTASTGSSYANKFAFNAKDVIKEMAALTDINQPVKISLQTSTVGTTSGTGTITVTGLNAGDTVTVNGLVYTAVTGSKGADDTKYSIDTSNDAAALDLADSIDDDTRTGLFGDVTATKTATDVVTVVAAAAGTFGNNVAFAESTGAARYTIQAGLSGGTEPLFNLPYDGALKMTVVYTVNCT